MKVKKSINIIIDYENLQKIVEWLVPCRPAVIQKKRNLIEVYEEVLKISE